MQTFLSENGKAQPHLEASAKTKMLKLRRQICTSPKSQYRLQLQKLLPVKEPQDYYNFSSRQFFTLTQRDTWFRGCGGFFSCSNFLQSSFAEEVVFIMVPRKLLSAISAVFNGFSGFCLHTFLFTYFGYKNSTTTVNI